MARLRLAALAVLLGAASLTAGQQRGASPESTVQTPTFRAEVEYVEVDALVLNEREEFVRDLTKDDFIVLEDGKPQTIAAFSVVDIPVEREQRPLYTTRPIEPDVLSNEKPFDGRTYVLILDDLHTDVHRTAQVKRAARQFIERNLGANDLMAIVNTGGRTEATQEFTNRKRLLIDAVDKFLGRKLPSVTLARNEDYLGNLGRNQLLRGAGLDRPNRDPYELERGYNAQATMSVLKSVAEWFGGVRGRKKTMLFISEGLDYDITEIIRQPGLPTSSSAAIYEDVRQTILATGRSNVAIYAVDPRGLSTLGDDTINVASFADDPGVPNINPRAINTDLQRAHENLRALAYETGGFAALNTNDFTNAFDRIVRDNSSYYVLAYYPPNPKRDGKFHRIQVRVKQPNMTVRARRGYVSPKGAAPAPRAAENLGASATTLAALNSPLPVSGLRMRVFTAPFKGQDAKTSVLVGVELAGRDLQLDNGLLELSYLAIDAEGKVHNGRTDKITLKLKPENKALVEQSGLRILNRLALKPGRYQLRVASNDVKAGVLGSVLYDLEVPSFDGKQLSISGLAVTSKAASGMLVAKQDEDLKNVLPTSPVGQRLFSSNDELTVFAEVYDTVGGAPHKVDITTTITSDTGTVVFKTAEERDSTELQGARGGYGHIARIPLADMPEGLYVLTVEGRSRQRSSEPVVRELPIQIVKPPSPPAG